MITRDELLRRLGDLGEPSEQEPAWLKTIPLEQLGDVLAWVARRARAEEDRYQKEVVLRGLREALHEKLRRLVGSDPDSDSQADIDIVIARTESMSAEQLRASLGRFERLERQSRGLDRLVRQLQLAISMKPTMRLPQTPPPITPPPPEPPPPAVSREAQITGWVEQTIEAASRPLQETSARWALDFGTARSKVALRDEQGVADEKTISKYVFPSLIAVERGGDGIRFGQDAEAIRGDAQRWTMVTSLKRLLIGHRAKVDGLHEWMTTERLAVLYLAWLLHTVDQNSPSATSPLDTPAQLSLPLVEGAEAPELWDLFDGATPTRKKGYKSWLPKAFRLGQLIALTFRDESWPTSQTELLRASMLWEQKPWSRFDRGLAHCSEPAAVMGDYEPDNLAMGLYLLVDCGAGTTDVSVFWNRQQGNRPVLHTVVESAAIIGGDTVDAAIVQVVLSRLAEAGQDGSRFEHTVRAWARDAKLTLLSGQPTTFDPASELGLESEIPFNLTLKDMADGLADLQAQVQAVVARTLHEADDILRRARPRGSQGWPEISDLGKVYLVGGSSKLAQVREAVRGALMSFNIGASPEELPKPLVHAAWADDRYRLMAVALGASRMSLQDPAPMPECLDRYGEIGNWHTDHDA